MSEDLKEERSSKNYWKYAFLILVGCLVAIMLVIGTRVFTVRETNLPSSETTSAKKSTPAFQVQLTKKQTNKLVEFYMNDYFKKSKGGYRFYLENQALLNGSIDVLGHPVEFSLYFEPFVLENGNIQLNAKSISIGTLNLPITYVLAYASKNMDLPSWIQINSKDQNVFLNLNEFALKNGMTIRADKINLNEDDIQFNIYLPKNEE